MDGGNLAQLVGLYETQEWQYFEKWIRTQIDTCVLGILQPETPEKDVMDFRFLAMAYQSVLDKVEADKLNYKESQKA